MISPRMTFMPLLIICVFDCEEGGPSFTAAIPWVYFPLGLCLAVAPDQMGAMLPCPSKSSVCPDHYNHSQLSIHKRLYRTPLSSTIRQEDIPGYISMLHSCSTDRQIDTNNKTVFSLYWVLLNVFSAIGYLNTASFIKYTSSIYLSASF